MIIKEKNKDAITVTFSSAVGRQGLNDIKEYIEFIEKTSTIKSKKVPQKIINQLSDEVNNAIWKKFKIAKGIK